MARWRIYYDDGTTISDNDCPVWSVPAVGVQVIAQPKDGREDDDRNSLIRGKDFYWWREDWQCWIMGDQAGLYDYLMNIDGPKKVLFGRSMLREDDFWAVVRRASEEGWKGV
jgi:hypothetical protein